MTEIGRYEAIQKHVQNQKDFWIHLAVFVVVNAGLTTLNLVNTPDELWFHWVLMGWGGGVLLHFVQVFGGKFTKNWEERQIRSIVKRDEEKAASRAKSSTP